MNAIYIKHPRSVSLFCFNYRQHKERSTIRGICIGTNGRTHAAPQKNAVVVSGLPFQDPSLIGVGLYVAAMLSRASPMLCRDVSVIPLAYPKEYERLWSARAVSAPFDHMGASPVPHSENIADWLVQENVVLEGSCKPLEIYITRKHKFIVNVNANLTPYGTSMQYKGYSFPSITKSKFFHPSFSSPSPLPPIHLPPSVAPNHSFSHSLHTSLNIHEQNPLVADMTKAPSFVVELTGTQALNDKQVVARGDEIIQVVRELLE